MIVLFIISGIIAVVLLAWLIVDSGLLLPPGKGIPILMYHKVSTSSANPLSIPADKFEEQMRHIHRKGYHTLSFAELDRIHSQHRNLPDKPLILTFDDAYADYFHHALPVLKKFELRSTVFIPVGYMGKTNEWDKGTDRIMTPDQVKEALQTDIVEVGLHSFTHRNYRDMSMEEMKEDLENCYQRLRSHKITFENILAYPYGAFPRKDKARNEKMKSLFRVEGVKFALRIGNSFNSWPAVDIYELKRIDIRGTDSFYTFKTKLRKGRKKLFS